RHHHSQWGRTDRWNGYRARQSTFPVYSTEKERPELLILSTRHQHTRRANDRDVECLLLVSPYAWCLTELLKASPHAVPSCDIISRIPRSIGASQVVT